MKTILLISSLLFLNACSTSYGPFTIISNKAINLENLDLKKNIQTTKYVTKSRGDSITPYNIPFGTLNPNVSSAMNNAFYRLHTGDYYTNATINEFWVLIPCIWEHHSITIDGDIATVNKK